MSDVTYLIDYKVDLPADDPQRSLESACGSVPTVTVTMSASTVTETVINVATPSAVVPVPSIGPTSAGIAARSSAAATTTLSSTSFLTSTKVISVDNNPVSEPAEPSSAPDGAYSFAEENGSTVWLGGKTPMSGAVYVTNTLVVTLQPQPSSTETVSFTTSSGTTLSSPDGTTTSWTTLSSTSFFTHYFTNALTPQTAATSLSAAKFSPYPGYNGWNATSTTLQRLPSGIAHIESSKAHPKDLVTSVTSFALSKLSGAHSKTPKVWTPSGHVAASVSFPVKQRQPRQVGALVTATIDGVVVTWTNVWAGESATTRPATSLDVPTSSTAVPTSEPFTVPGYSWNSNPEPRTSAVPQPKTSNSQPPSSAHVYSTISSTSDTALSSTVPISLLPTSDSPSVAEYSWNANPVPWTSATSQPLISIIQTSSERVSTASASASLSIVASTLPTSLRSSNTGLWTAQPSTKTSSSTISLAEPTPRFPNATQSIPATTTTASCGNDNGRFTIDFDDLPHFSADASNTDIPPILNPYRKLFFNGGFGYVNRCWLRATRIDLIGYDAFKAEIATQTLLQPPCPGLVNCKLAEITFTDQFRDLAGLQILAYINKTPVTFYMDDLSLGWSNNTCAAQFERASAQ
ncbi:MAG: hypothetical protein Q9166_004904 [cf. Caloplaca sp. 2 TL-2023]